MTERDARDWTKEPWIKQHTRESLNELLWPLMQRALRDYIRKRAEADGTLVDGQDDPVGSLLRVLGAHDSELEFARSAIMGLLREGILESDGRSLWMPERPASQARPHIVGDGDSRAPNPMSSEKRTSTERVREHRRRKREKRNASPGVSAVVPAVPDAVSLPVTSSVSLGVPPSRGDRYLEPLVSEKDQKKSEDIHLLHLDRERALGGVSLTASLSVSPETENEDDEDETRIVSRDEDADEQPELSASRFVRAVPPLADALSLDVAARAGLVVDNPELAEQLRPDKWPEIQALGAAFAHARNCSSQPLGRYAHDKAVELAVALYAAGYSQTDLVQVVTAVAAQEWAKGKGLGSLLTFKVVDANRPRPLAKAGANLSPRAAAALARARAGYRTREAG